LEDAQSAPAAAAAEGTAEQPTASAPTPDSTGGPLSWEAAFAEDAVGASNRGDRTDIDVAAAAPPAPAAADEAAAPEGEAAPAGADRAPQPGSRRAVAAELTDLRTQVQTVMSELEAERTRAATLESEKTQAATEAEDFLGKPGELAGLLAKEAADGWLENEAHERKLQLIRNSLLYAPLKQRALTEAQTEHEGRFTGLVRALSEQVRSAAALPGVDAEYLEKTPDVGAILKHVHAAGAATRDGEIAELKGQLDDARSRAFVSQPPLATGGVSGNGRSGRGYDPQKSPVANLEEAFAEAAPATTNGRR
jgi:hypothetical protein